jgi:hypothetical protein
MTKFLCTICWTVAIVGCGGRHVTDDLRDENGQVEIHNARPVDRLEDSEDDFEDSEDDSQEISEEDVGYKNFPRVTKHTLTVGGTMFRRDGAFAANLGSLCEMTTFWKCEFKGSIAGKDKAQLESMAKPIPAFNMSADSDESSEFQSKFPELFDYEGKSSGTSDLNVEGTISIIYEDMEIMEMINENQTRLDFLAKMEEPHIVTAIITAQKFEDFTSFSGRGEYGASKDALKAAAKAGVAVGAAAATGGASAIPAAFGGQVISGLGMSPGLKKMKKVKVKSGVVGGEAHRLAKAPPGVDDGIGGKNTAGAGIHVKLGAGTVVGYEVKKVVFKSGLFAGKRVENLETTTPECDPGDGTCFVKQKLNWPKTMYMTNEFKLLGFSSV